MNQVSSCPECDPRGISIENNLEKKFELACCLELSCNNCNWPSLLYSSKEIETKDTAEAAEDLRLNSIQEGEPEDSIVV